jgi:hypothetical protein
MVLLAYSYPGHRRAGKDLHGMPFLGQADPQTGIDAANDLVLMAIHCVGVGHLGAVSPGHRRVPISLCHYRQIYQVARNDPCGQNQQVICRQVHQVNHL